MNYLSNVLVDLAEVSWDRVDWICMAWESL